jgi:1-acyl-sn-glycerol-3-phosphate acyltransferase
MPYNYSLSKKYSLNRAIMRPLFRGLFHILSRVQVFGKENVPRQGAYLITINHVSLFEPPLVMAFWPVALEAVGAVDIWKRRGQATLARLYGAIPVHRGEYDRTLLDAMLAVLNSGRPLLIAPEGARSHAPGMRQAHPGAAYIVDKTGVQVVPVGVVGGTDDFLRRALRGQRPPLEMRIGQPFSLPLVEGRGAARRAALQENADRIMRQIAALMPAEYHGIYA